MTTITLPISKNYIVPDIINTLTCHEVESILNLINTIHNLSIDNIKDSIIKAKYKKQIDNLTAENDNLAAENEKYQFKISEYEKNNALTQKITTLEQQIQQTNTLLINNNNQDYIERLTTSIQPIVNFMHGSNAEKGALGESLIFNSISNDARYNEAQLKDTSKIKASGDFHMYWNKMRCLFEIKNKIKITIDDMAKFERDIKEMSSTINCGIFISLKTNIFPGRNRDALQLDIINNIPVIYAYITNIDQIHYSILCIKYIIESSVNNNQTSNELLLAYFHGYMSYTKRQFIYFTKMIKNKESELRLLHKELAHLITIQTDIESDSYKFISEPSIDETENVIQEINNDNNDIVELDFSSMEKSYDVVVQYYVECCILKKSCVLNDILKKFNLTKHLVTVHFGGIANIKKKAKSYIINKYITEDIINRLKLYKAANGAYPDRNEFISNFISRRTLSKINAVIKEKRILNYIYNLL